jgi:hypothetical protein
VIPRLLLLLLLLPAPALARRHVLAVGSDAGDPDQPRLRYAESEASRFAGLLVALGGVDPADITVLRGPDRAAYDAAWRGLAARVGPEDEVFVYLSGHARAGRLSLHGEAVEPAELQAAIGALPGAVVVAVVDACTSGALVRDKGGAPDDAFAVTLAPPDARGRVLITSAGRSELAWESDRAGGSLFAGSLLAGLRGAADRDEDGDVTLFQAYEYVYGRTVAESLARAGIAQRPHLDADLTAAGDLVVTRLGDRARLSVPAEFADADVFVVMDGVAVAELPPRSGAVELALPSGRALVYVRRQGAARLHRVELTAGATTRLEAGGLLASLDPLRSRGGAVFRRMPSVALAPGAWLSRGLKPRVRGGARAFVEVQATRMLVVGGSAVVAGGSFANDTVVVPEVVAVGGAGAWLSPAGRVQPRVGGRVEGGALVQVPRWAEPDWHGLGAPELQARTVGALHVTGSAGVQWRFGPQISLVLELEGGLALQGSQPSPLLGVTAALRLAP